MCKIAKNPKVREAQNCRQLLINARLSAAYNSWCHSDVKKTCYSNPVKINTMVIWENRCNMHVITNKTGTSCMFEAEIKSI